MATHATLWWICCLLRCEDVGQRGPSYRRRGGHAACSGVEVWSSAGLATAGEVGMVRAQVWRCGAAWV
eukprot:74334-Chlamydomonas_euryale.AAC.1